MNLEDISKKELLELINPRMVSEGVDIPRLRVGIYATNITKELTFRQIIGRVVRRQDEYDNRTP